MASTATDGSISPRQWVTLVTGVAVASSALSIVGVLGVQRLSRQRRRHDLEDDVRNAAKRAQQKRQDKGGAGHNEQEPTRLDKPASSVLHGYEKGDVDSSSDSTPRYLAALNAVQEATARTAGGSGHTTPARVGSPRPSVQMHSQSPASSYSAASAKQSVLRHSANAEAGTRPSLPPSMSSSSRKMGSSLMAAPVNYDESLIREQLSRNYSFLGDEAMAKLRGAFVIVVGAGGVGSWCAIMLLRSGVGRIRIIDFDQVSLSSLNRHACATLADVGRPKVTVCKEKFAEIAPWADVDARVEIFKGSDAPRLLGSAQADANRKLKEQAPTYVIDCIDNLDTKVDLLDYCYKCKIRCFSSMGAGAKADPSLIQVGDLNTTAEDPLARRVRRELRSRGVWGGGVLEKAADKTAKAGKAVKGKEGRGPGKEAGASGSAERRDGASRSTDSQQQRQLALDQLEGNLSKSTRKLQDSGRVANAIQANPSAGVKKKTDSMDGKASTPMSRRASSTSSHESVFYSPLSSPFIDGKAELNGGDNSENTSPQPFRLQVEEEAHDGRRSDSDNTMNGFTRTDKAAGETCQIRNETLMSPSEEQAASDDKKQRPSLAALQPPRSENRQSSSRRASSLQELAAEDIRSSQSGRPAPPPSPGLAALASMAEEIDEDASGSDSSGHDKRKPPHTIMCVYSNEKSDTRLMPLDEEEFQKGHVDELAALEDFRVRILPVLGPLPAMFGLAAATYVICDIAGKELEPLPGKNRRRMADRMWTELESTERKYPSPGSGFKFEDRAIGPRRIPWSIEDVQYVFEEVYRSRSVVPPYETLSYGRLLRWDSTLPISFSNVALFSKGQATKHENEVLKLGRSPVEVWGDQATRMYKRRMADERRMGKLR